jgi:signal transduction histidine kinase
MKDEFLANVSHELRTPLNAILGYAELLTSHQIGALQPAQASAVGKIDDAATILHHLITDLLELSHLKLGRVDLVVTTEDAVRLARRASELVGPSPDGIDFSIESDEGLVPISTDGEKVTKILTHLVANAFKFTSAGRVGLHVAPCHGPQGGWVEWRVSDTGVGIRAEDLSAIFDEFTQVDGSSTRLYGGTGLGLALSQRLAQLLGGEISVESEPNAGSRFTLRLPNRVQGS